MPHVIEKLRKAEEEGKVAFSVEYFSPKTEVGFTKLYEKWEKLAALGPLFADVTWGAGGSTAEGTTTLCRRGQKDFGLEMNMHLTCTNMPRDRVEQALQDCKAMGVTNIVALRGDPPNNVEEWTPIDSGFTCALELVEYIRKHHGDYFGISVAGYPEGHPCVINPVGDRVLTPSEQGRVCDVEGVPHVCSDADYVNELAYLKKKVDAGSDFIITQLFFDAEVFRTFVRDCRNAGITVPILPGIMPIVSHDGFFRMTKMCKTRVPEAIAARIKELKEQPDALKAFGQEQGVACVKSILDDPDLKVPAIHMYTLNSDVAPYGILRSVGLMPPP